MCGTSVDDGAPVKNNLLPFQSITMLYHVWTSGPEQQEEFQAFENRNPNNNRGTRGVVCIWASKKRMRSMDRRRWGEVNPKIKKNETKGKGRVGVRRQKTTQYYDRIAEICSLTTLARSARLSCVGAIYKERQGEVLSEPDFSRSLEKATITHLDDFLQVLQRALESLHRLHMSWWWC